MHNAAQLFASLILAASTAQAPPPERAPDWQLLNNPTEFVVFWWDRASVVRDGDIVRVVVRTKPRIVTPGPGYADFLTEIRCADRTSRIIRTTNYGMKGEPLVDDDAKAKFRKIDAPYAEKLRSSVC